MGVLVPSHWVLDFVVHRPDLPLWPGGPEVGLALWNSIAGTLIVEFGLLLIGAWLFLTTTSPLDRIGSWGTYGLMVLLVLVYLGSTFGPPPADASTVALSVLALWVVVGLAWWVDNHREQLRSPGDLFKTVQ